MKYCKQLVVAIAAFSMAVLVSCNKNHYDVDNVSGVNAEGEMLLPLAYKTTTMMNLMERFQIDSLISCADDGSLYYELFYDAPEVVKGSDILKIDDIDYHEHIELDTNYIQSIIPVIFDTVIKFDLPLQFGSDYVKVWDAWLRSGRFDFDINSTIPNIKRIVVRSSDITDENGNNMELPFDINGGSFSLDLAGMHYQTEEPNTLNLGFDLYLAVQWTNAPGLSLDIDVKGTDIAIRQMTGSVYPTVFSGRIDTVYNIFPSNISGQLKVNDARLKIAARNLFNLETRFEVDTALVYANDYEPYSFLDPLPIVDLPQELTMTEIYNRKFDCTIQAHNGRVLASYYISLNPHGNVNGNLTTVSVADTCTFDAQLGVEIPFAFNASDIYYYDTATISFDAIELPDLIESLTLDLDITSSLPLNLNGWFYLYDSQTGMITDTLNADGKIIEASYTGLPTSNTISIEITPDRLDNVLHSDRIVMMFEVDTDSRDVKLNAQQELGVFVRGKVKYNGVITDNN